MGICRSEDLRVRVVAAVAGGSSRRAAAERFSVSVSSAIRWCARAAEEGGPAARRQGRPAGKVRWSRKTGQGVKLFPI